MKRVLLLGGSGQLGSDIRRVWDAAIDAPSHAEVDLADDAQIAKRLERGYDIVVNCAAFHNVDLCEKHPEQAFQYNAIAVSRLAELCAKRDVEFLTISTDYVFDGTSMRPYSEGDCPAPIQAYGTSKLAGEFLARNRWEKTFVVRTCGLYGVKPSSSKGYTFIDRILTQLANGQQPRVVNDVIASPTYAKHLARALWALVNTKHYGTYHAANAGPVSWFDFANEGARLAGSQGRIEPTSAEAWPATARRPKYSALAGDGLRALGIELPDWRSGLAEYVADKDREVGHGR